MFVGYNTASKHPKILFSLWKRKIKLVNLGVIHQLMNRLENYISDIERLCKSHKVSYLYVFGSILTDDFSSESDIDLIVDFSDMAVEDYADNYFDFKFSLQDVLKRPIDLLEEKAIKNPYFKQSVVQKQQLIYGQ